MAQFRVCHVKQQWKVAECSGGVAHTLHWPLWGVAFANVRRSGWGAKNLNLSRHGLVSGVLCQMVMKSGERRWLGGLYSTTVVAECCIHKREEGRGLGVKNPEPSYHAQFWTAFGLHVSF
jgi:hypothetical protein